MVVMSITWHTAQDDRVCPICLPLDNYVWTFDTAKEPFPNELWSPQHGIRVWDLVRDEPRPHGNHILNCRCSIEITFDYTAIEQAISDKITWAYQLKVLPPASTVTPT